MKAYHKFFLEIDEIKLTIRWNYKEGSGVESDGYDQYDGIVIEGIYLHLSDVDITDLLSESVLETINYTMIKALV